MKNKETRSPEINRMIQENIARRQAIRSRQNRITGFLFAGCLFLAGFLVGVLLF